jgi:hypothetical protein
VTRKLLSIAIGLFTACGAALAAVVCLAILDIYLAGHSHRTLMDNIVIGHPDSSTRLSIADLIALAVSVGAGVAAAWLSWPSARGLPR